MNWCSHCRCSALATGIVSGHGAETASASAAIHAGRGPVRRREVSESGQEAAAAVPVLQFFQEGDDLDPEPELENGRSDAAGTAAAAAAADSVADGETAPGLRESSTTDIVLFKIAHREPSGLKRPLAAVDNVKFGDVAIQLYSVQLHSADDSGPTYAVSRQRGGLHDLCLLRFLESFSANGLEEQALIREMKVWKHNTTTPVGLAPDVTDQLSPEGMQMISDMAAARAFAGAGRWCAPIQTTPL